MIRKIDDGHIQYWFPSNRLPDGYNTHQPVESHGITHVHHFYTRRNLRVLASIWGRISSIAFRNRLTLAFCFTANLRSVSRLASVAFSYYFKGGGGPINAGTKGTLYVSSTVPEVAVLKGFDGRATSLAQVFNQGAIYRHPANKGETLITTQSSSVVDLPECSIDYVFIDPPFEGNLMYSELSFYWETWLRTLTNNKLEAIVNKVQHKGLLDYQHLMELCFREFYRVLKSGHWMTVEFHNSQNAVWNAIQEAILRAGFMVADVRSLDKKQGSFKQYTTSTAVKQDLIISAYKPATDFEQGFLAEGGREKGAWEFIRQHLEQLPIVVERPASASDSALALEIIAERQAYLLYDRMVAFHIQRGFSVSLSAAEFYAGLRQRFPERDGMYFLPTQAAEYDQRRLRASKVEQLALFVTDEKSALQWLQRELDPETGSGSQTYQRALRKSQQQRWAG